MAEIVISQDDPHAPDATALLQASHALMQSLFPAESNHYLSVDALTAPGVRFFTARRDGVALGCAALAVMEGYGEVKSMFVAPEARGAGVGEALLARIDAQAREESLPVLRLETGSKLEVAHRLYRRAGFTERGPFGDYPDDPNSLFMEKPLA